MRILITGGAGYIGSHTAEEAVKRGHEVYIVDNLSNSTWDNIRTISEVHNAPIVTSTEDEWMYELLNIQPDAIIHLAALKSVTQSQRIPLKYTENNVCGMELYLNDAINNDIPFVLASSAAVYGSGAEEFKVGDKIAPENVYGMNKAICEAMANRYDKSVILRYFNVAGAGEHTGEEYGRLGNFVPRIYQQPDLQLRKINGKFPVRDYVHVLDIARINIDAAEGKVKGTHNIASGIGTDVKQLTELAGRKDYVEVDAEGEAEKLIGHSDLELRYNIEEIINSTNKWYEGVRVF